MKKIEQPSEEIRSKNRDNREQLSHPQIDGQGRVKAEQRENEHIAHQRDSIFHLFIR
mgnify:FL=1